MATLEKYPQDARVFIFDFAEVEEVIAGASPVSAVVSATPGGDDALTLGTPAVVGDTVHCAIAGGTAEVVYRVEVLATLTGGSVYTEVMPLIVLA